MRRHLFRYHLGLFLFLAPLSVVGQSWLAGYEFRKELTLNGTDISGDHTGFPALIELSSDSDLSTNARSDGYDIVFTSSDGSTMLDHELLTYTSGTGAYRGYVKVDIENATNETIYMYYGNSGADTNPSSTNVWDTNFQTVLHLQESGNGTANEFVDASTYGVHGTGGGTAGSGSAANTPTLTTGKFGSAQDFDGAGDRIRLAAINDDDWTAFTVQVWVNPDDTGDDRLFGKCWGTGADDETWLLRQSGGTIGCRTNVNNGGADNDLEEDDDDNPVAYNTGTWYLAAYTWSASDNTVRVYLNGTEVSSGALTGSNLTLNNEPSETDNATLGNIPGGGRDFNGQLQEARVSDVVRTADWLLTEYNIEDDPAGFISAVGSEEQCGTPVPVGGTAVASNSTILSGASTTITLSGQNTTPLQWQSSSDNITFTDVSGETGTSLSTGVLTATTYYRVQVGSGSCQVLSSVATVTVLPPFVSGYCYRKPVTILESQVPGAGTLSNFPVLIDVTDTDLRSIANNGQVESSNGYDITFTSSDGTTGLSHEIISYDATSGEYNAWVNVPTVSASTDTEIYLYYGNSAVVSDPSTTTTWNSDFVAVWHLDEDPNGDVAGAILDATSNNNDGQPQGTMTTADLITGQIGSSIDFDGTDDYITVPDATSLQITDNTITLSAWVNTEGDLDNDEGFILKGANNNESFLLGTNNNGTSNEQLRGRINDSGNNFDAGSVPTTGWHYATVVYTGTNVIGYVDGVQQFSSALTENIEAGVGEAILLGTRADLTGTRFFEGILDELRISEAAHSADWVQTEYNNQSSPSTFFTLGEEQYPHDGGTANAASSEVESGSSTTITLSGQEDGSTLQWQSSTDNVNFSDIGGETTSSLSTGTLTQETYFRAIVNSSGCEAISSVATVRVTPTFLSGYCYRKRITIDATKVNGSGTLTNFPMLFVTTDSDIRSTANGGQVTSANGFDISFTDDSGVALSHEIEVYEAGSGSLSAWINVPSVSAITDTEIYMYYGNSSVSSDPSLTTTWDTDFSAIWHLNEDFLDATSNNNDGTEGASGSTDDIEGIVGRGRGFTGVSNGDSWISVPNSTSIDTDISDQVTLEAWARYYLPVPEDAPFIMKSPSVNNERYMLGTDGGTNPAQINQRITTGDGHFRFDDGAVDANWHHYVMVYDANLAANPRLKVYIDGVLTITNDASGSILSDATNPLYIGRRLDNRRYRGVLDELRISKVARSEDWIITEYTNQSSPETFYSIGAESYPGNGGTAEAANATVDFNTGTDITLSGHTGTIQWQSSDDNSSFSDLSGQTSTGLSTGNLTTTTYFRAVLTDGGCEAFSNTVQVSVRPDFVTGYSFRKKITIDHTKVDGSTNHTDFPLLFSSTDADLILSNGKVQNANGYDIVFALSDGTLLDHDIETYDGSTGEFVSWVRIPNLLVSADTEVFMYYGNCTFAGGDPSTANTFDSNYLGVYHLNDDLGSTTVIDDRTINGNDGTAVGTMNGADVVTGQIGNGFDFDGGDDYLNLGTSPQVIGSSVRTIELWGQPQAFDNGGLFQAGTIANDFSLHTSNGTTDNWFVEFETSNDEFTLSSSLNNWHHYALVYTGSEVRLYYDGVLFDQTTAVLGTGVNDVQIARWNNVEFDGLVDEVKISNVVRSTDWIATEFNNQNDPSTFYAIEDEIAENQWTGGSGNTDWNDPGNWSFCSVPATSSDILVPSGLSFYPALDQNRTVGIVNIETGAVLDLNGFTLTLEGDFVNDGTFTANNGTVIMTGSAEQDITGSSMSTFYNLTINKSGQAAELRQEISVTNELNLTAGNISLNDHDAILTNTASIVGGSSVAYVITDGTGQLCLNEISTPDGTVLFPIGPTATSYNPVSINNTGTADTFCARIANNVYSGGTIGSGTLQTENVIDRTWFVDESVAGGSNVTITLQWNGSHELTGFNRSDMSISHHTGAAWEAYATGLSSSGSDPYTASVSGVSSFSPVGGGSAGSPLPVDLVTFSAKSQGFGVLLEWSTVSEKDNDFFVIERSVNGIDFRDLDKVAGAGTIQETQDYTYFDEKPLTGINYYRLRQTDFDGQFEYSTIVSILNSGSVENVSIYPNPGNGSFSLEINQLSSDSNIGLKMFDMNGKVVWEQMESIRNEGTLQKNYDLSSELKKGLFILQIDVNGTLIQKKIGVY